MNFDFETPLANNREYDRSPACLHDRSIAHYCKLEGLSSFDLYRSIPKSNPIWMRPFLSLHRWLKARLGNRDRLKWHRLDAAPDFKSGNPTQEY